MKNLFGPNGKNGTDDGATVLNFLDLHKEPQENLDGSYKVNLRNYGFKLAGQARGVVPALKAGLNRIRESAIQDAAKDQEGTSKYKAELQNEIQLKEKQITEIKQKIAALEKKIESANENLIPDIELKIKELESQKENLENEVARKKDAIRSNPFMKTFYWTIFVAATVYLFLFYVSATYSAFFREAGSILSQGVGADELSQMFHAIFVPEAYQTLNFHWLLPIPFFVIGIVLHQALEKEGYKKWLAIPGALAMILVADALLAYFMESRAHEIKYLMGFTDSPDYFMFTHAIVDPAFYFILVLGSVSVFCWTLIMHTLSGYYSDMPALKEIQSRKKQINSKIRKLKSRILNQKESLKNLETDIRTQTLDLEAKEGEVVYLEGRIADIHYSPSRLAHNVLAFYQGWVQYVSNLKDSAMMARTEEAFRETVQEMELTIPGFTKYMPIEQEAIAS